MSDRIDRTDRLEAIAARFLEAFQSKQLPKTLARLFFAEPAEEISCHRWSARNRFITLIEGHDDARGFRQWQEVGRFVKKGETAFFILSPIVPSEERRKEEVAARGITLSTDDNEPRRPSGFRYTAVFGYHQTDGAPIAEYEDRRRKVEALPLVDVAHSWGLEVRSLHGHFADLCAEAESLLRSGIRSIHRRSAITCARPVWTGGSGRSMWPPSLASRSRRSATER